MVDKIFEFFNIELRKKLILLFENFLEEGYTPFVLESASQISTEYINSGEFNLDKDLFNALRGVGDLELQELSIEKAKEILQDISRV